MAADKAIIREPVDELSVELGSHLRSLRLRKNWTQRELAERAGIALNVVRHLEEGSGSTVEGLIRALKALGRADWLSTLAPEVAVSPMLALKAASAAPRRRAFVKRRRDKDGLQTR